MRLSKSDVVTVAKLYAVWAAMSNMSHQPKLKPFVQHTCVDSAAVWVENFLDGKFLDTWVNLEISTPWK